jgi:hypothetical protein
VTKSISNRWGILTALAQQQGKQVGNIDGLLAATALEHDLTMVTRNTRHFEGFGVPFLDPWRALCTLSLRSVNLFKERLRKTAIFGGSHAKRPSAHLPFGGRCLGTEIAVLRFRLRWLFPVCASTNRSATVGGHKPTCGDLSSTSLQNIPF